MEGTEIIENGLYRLEPLPDTSNWCRHNLLIASKKYGKWTFTDTYWYQDQTKYGFGEKQYFDNFLKNLREFGWLACAGTKGRYDKLFIPPEEMQKIDFGEKI